MRKSETPNGKRAGFHQWWQHLPSYHNNYGGKKGKKRSNGKSYAQMHWSSVRGITKQYIQRREWERD